MGDAAPARRALLLDRDGTVIVDHPYNPDPEKVTLLPGVASCLRVAQDRGAVLLLVSNQSGIGRGLLTWADVEAIERTLARLLYQEGVQLSGSYYCPHAPSSGCSCRKPGTDLILRAARDFDLDLGASVMVGDKESDVDAGRGAGCTTVRLASEDPPPESNADFVVGDWNELSRVLAGVWSAA